MRPSAGFVAFVADATVHVANQLVDQRQPEPLPVLLARDERLEDVFAQRRVYVGRGEVLDLGDVVLKPARFLTVSLEQEAQLMMRRAKMI